ncbi:MAG TPA: hypothetical protein ENH91_16170 [Leeuwenhoekiella sp.]|nr:hypothetical protein [Leeuwenhoekiella sp.]
MVPLLPDRYYHIYNRANGDERIFRTAENYSYFLRRYAYFINPVASTLSYCLMPNHFHFLVRIKNDVSKEKLEGHVSKQFSNLFSSYTQAFNKQQKRKGSLFMKNFKRKN